MSPPESETIDPVIDHNYTPDIFSEPLRLQWAAELMARIDDPFWSAAQVQQWIANSLHERDQDAAAECERLRERQRETEEKLHEALEQVRPPKKCTLCGQHKPLTQFRRQGVDADGSARYAGKCKPCLSSYEKNQNRKTTHKVGIGYRVRITDTDTIGTVIGFLGSEAYTVRTDAGKIRRPKIELVEVLK